MGSTIKVVSKGRQAEDSWTLPFLRLLRNPNVATLTIAFIPGLPVYSFLLPPLLHLPYNFPCGHFQPRILCFCHSVVAHSGPAHGEGG